MATLPPNSGMPTTRGMNFFDADRNLAFALRQHASPDDVERALPLLQELGGVAGNELDELAALADQNPPTLRSFDSEGQRVDAIDYHPAFVEMQKLGFSRFGFRSNVAPGGRARLAEGAFRTSSSTRFRTCSSRESSGSSAQSR